MKKTFLFSMALAAALSSCTKDSAIENDNNNGTNLDLNPNAPVAIQLGAGSNISAGVEEQPKSRAVVDAWNNTKVGIYALSKEGGWKDTQNPNNPTVLWENVKGTIASGTQGAITDFDLSKENGGKQDGYYPNQGTLNYNFYGYYLSDTPDEWTKPTIDETGKIVTTTFTIDGTDDVLWGKAEATTLNGIGDDSGTTYDGYNAKYFRKGADAATPVISFKHLLTQLQFHVYKSATFESQTLFLRSIKVTEVNTNLTLTIADVSDANGEGKLGIVTGGGTTSITVPNITGNGIDINAAGVYEPDAEITATDRAVMLYTDGETTKTFKIEVELAGGTDDNSATSTNTLTISAPNNEAYGIGKQYNVILKINSLMSIELEGVLEKWTPVDTPIEGEI